MRKAIGILLLSIGLSASAATYHVASWGTNSTANDGSESEPWATVSYALNFVTAGDVIYIDVGIINETSQIVLPVGVSITGAGIRQSVLRNNTGLNPLLLASSSAGTNGNQSISYITIDGMLSVQYGVRIYGRNNFIIHDVEFKNTLRYALTFSDKSRSTTVAPSPYCTGNKIYNCIFTNCGRDTRVDYGYYTWEADAALDVSGQSGMDIYDNDIDNITGGRHAYGIKGLIGGGFNRGLKIHHNKIRTGIRDISTDQSFGFNIELWTGEGGIEIYENDLNGCIDMGGYGYWDDYGYGFAFIVQNNKIVQPIRPTYQGEAGMILEGGGRDGCHFLRNWVENFTTGLTLGATGVALVQGYEDVTVAYNVFANIGWASGSSGYGMTGYNSTPSLHVNNLKFLNNVVYKVTGGGGYGINFNVTSMTWNDTEIRNNIFVNAGSPVEFRNQTLAGINTDNNIFYSYTDTPPEYPGCTVSDNTFNNNLLNINPEFLNAGVDFRLESTSDAINAGVNVGLTSDYLGNPVPVGGYDIGAYEYNEFDYYLPIVVTEHVFNITDTTATTGGTVTYDGGGVITARGVCWNTSPSPQVTDSKTEDGTGTGTFTSAVTGLTNGETYYLRAYATNSFGTAYGLQLMFTTPISTSVGASFMENGGMLIMDESGLSFIRTD
jgi:hypothetical protein